MKGRRFALQLLPDRLAIARLPAGAEVPDWAGGGGFFSVTRTAGELSVVAAADRVPEDVQSERTFRVFRVTGPLDFSETGVLASLVQPLAQAGVSVFSVSTFDTDYLLVRDSDFDRAVQAWQAAGHTVEEK